jgi:hypothetical protein
MAPATNRHYDSDCINLTSHLVQQRNNGLASCGRVGLNSKPIRIPFWVLNIVYCTRTVEFRRRGYVGSTGPRVEVLSPRDERGKSSAKLALWLELGANLFGT